MDTALMDKFEELIKPYHWLGLGKIAFAGAWHYTDPNTNIAWIAFQLGVSVGANKEA